MSLPPNSSHQGRTIGDLRHAHAPQSAFKIHGKGLDGMRAQIVSRSQALRARTAAPRQLSLDRCLVQAVPAPH